MNITARIVSLILGLLLTSTLAAQRPLPARDTIVPVDSTNTVRRLLKNDMVAAPAPSVDTLPPFRSRLWSGVKRTTTAPVRLYENLWYDEEPRPVKALIFSGIMPGLGQAYNDSDWKIPLVYAGLGTAASIAIFNQDNYRRFQTALELRLDGDPNTIDEFEALGISTQVLRNNRDDFRGDTERAYIAVGIIYLLQALEAYVDAHLQDFSVSDDLSSGWRLGVPSPSREVGATMGVGLYYSF